jgi:hypothetical protein
MKGSHRLALEAMQHLPRRPDEDQMDNPAYRNPIPRGSCPVKTPSIKKQKVNTKERIVMLADVRSHQSSVFGTDLCAHIRRERAMKEDLPVVFEHDGLFYVNNGNHRIVAMMLKRRVKMKMKMRVVPVGASAPRIRRRHRNLAAGMRIAVIGWGSLIWDPRKLDRQSGWHTSGPRLPIEFARISNDGRLTLVMLSGAALQQTYWALSGLETLDSARNDLSQREGTSKLSTIHWATRTVAHDPDDPNAGLVQAWLSEQAELDAAIWTGLRQTLGTDVLAEAVAYLTGLKPDDDAYDRAREYLIKTPAQIQTRVRKAMQSQGWTDEVLPDDLFER